MKSLRPAVAVLGLGLAMLIASQRHASAAADVEAGDHGPSRTAVESQHESDGNKAVEHGEQEKNLGPLDFKTDLAIWTFAVFAVLFVVLRKFAWGPIVSALDQREHRIAEDINNAKRANEEARQLLADYERKLQGAQDEVRAILDEARRDAEHTQQQILARARTDAEAEVARGRRDIETATAQALSELARASADLAVDLASKIVQSRLTASDHARLIDEAMANFPQGDPRRN